MQRQQRTNSGNSSLHGPSARTTTIAGAVVLTVAVLFVPAPVSAQVSAQFGKTLALGDFNADGVTDVAVGSPNANVDGRAAAGRVNVYYGGVRRIGDSDTPAQEIDLLDFFWSGSRQFPPRSPGAVWFPSAARFGFSLAVGDFDLDEYADLAIGAPGAPTTLVCETLACESGFVYADDPKHGVVAIVPGGPNGLDIERGYLLFGFDTFRSPVGEPIADEPMQFGYALAAPLQPGHNWLAVGATDRTVDGVRFAGAVAIIRVLPTSAGFRLDPTNAAEWHQNLRVIPGAARFDDQFGQALSVGNFNGDAFADLVIGVPNRELGGRSSAGVVYVLYGRSGNSLGLGPGGELAVQLWHQDVIRVAGGAESADGFGFALAAGDFDDNGADDLAVGVPGESVQNGSARNPGAGAVNVFYGRQVDDDQSTVRAGPGVSLSAGLGVRGNQIWYQGRRKRLAGRLEPHDGFGFALATGDFDGDGYADLGVGVPNENIDNVAPIDTDAGAAHVVRGGPNRLTSAGDLLFYQDQSGVPGVSRSRNRFGHAVAIGHVNRIFPADLLIGAPGERVSSSHSGGTVTVIYHQDNVAPQRLTRLPAAGLIRLPAAGFDGVPTRVLGTAVPSGLRRHR